MEDVPFETLRLLVFASPVIAILLGFAFFCVWLFQARKPHVLLLAATFVLFALATVWQLGPASWPGSGLYSFSGCVSYVICGFALAEGILRQVGKKLPRRLGGLYAAGLILLLAYFSFINNQIFIRIQILTYSCALLFLLCVLWLRHIRNSTHANKMLFWVLLAFAVSFLLRGVLFRLLLSSSSPFNATATWIFLHLSLMIFVGMLAIALMLAISSAEIDNLKRERDIDSLTQLLNRRGFFTAANVIARQTHLHPVSLLVLDIDHFKRINDRYGHAAGDQVLQIVGQLIQTTVRSTDIAARIGGEEFAILMPITELDAASRLAERLRNGFSQTSYTSLTSNDVITGSFGITLLHTGESIYEALKRADSLMYSAKVAGRDRVASAHTSSDRPTSQTDPS